MENPEENLEQSFPRAQPCRAPPSPAQLVPLLGFSSCLRTSHPNWHGKPNWKPQKAITLKALRSESRARLAAPAPAHGAVPPGHRHAGRLHTWNNTAASPGREEGLAGLPNSPPSSIPLPPSHREHNHAAEPGQRMFVSASLGDVTTNKNYTLVLETPNSFVTLCLVRPHKNINIYVVTSPFTPCFVAQLG